MGRALNWLTLGSIILFSYLVTYGLGSPHESCQSPHSAGLVQGQKHGLYDSQEDPSPQTEHPIQKAANILPGTVNSTNRNTEIQLRDHSCLSFKTRNRTAGGLYLEGKTDSETMY